MLAAIDVIGATVETTTSRCPVAGALLAEADEVAAAVTDEDDEEPHAAKAMAAEALASRTSGVRGSIMRST
jgi:pyrimidine deaminase RibD-like protein